MSRVRSTGALLALCALLLCALGAANAQAAGQTAFKCVKGTGTPEYTAHCEEEKVGGGFITEAITETAATGEAVGNTRLAATLFGLEFEILCTASRTLGGKVTNTTVGTTMFAHGTEGRIDFTGCTATKLKKGVPTTETCTVIQAGGVSGTITTNKLTGTSLAEHNGVVKPEEESSPFVEFELRREGVHTKCPVEKANVAVTGKVTAAVPTTKRSHATANVTKASNELLANLASAEYSATTKGSMTAEPEVTVALETS